jgi:magnesium-transporting ATPase (P-type)
VAQSPEELSLVSFASEMGIKFIDRNFKDGSINLVINGTPHVIKLKAVIEFSSERKCMSVLVEHQNRYLLYCKGADNVILKKTSKLCNAQP